MPICSKHGCDVTTVAFGTTGMNTQPTDQLRHAFPLFLRPTLKLLTNQLRYWGLDYGIDDSIKAVATSCTYRDYSNGAVCKP